MRNVQHRPVRAGATIMETAFVLPIVFFLLIGLGVGASGIMRYQEVATLAREGSRYGSTHGYQYRKDSGLPMGTADEWEEDIIKNGIEPRTVSLDKTRLVVDVSWPPVVNQPSKPDNWPGSRVDVTVTYTWIPPVLWTSPIVLQSKSSMPITN